MILIITITTPKYSKSITAVSSNYCGKCVKNAYEGDEI